MIEETRFFHYQTVLMLDYEVYFINLQIFAHGCDGNIFLICYLLFFLFAIIWYLVLFLKQNVIFHGKMKTEASDIIIVRDITY